jgi:Carboxypeptidase regulatory-like domain
MSPDYRTKRTFLSIILATIDSLCACGQYARTSVALIARGFFAPSHLGEDSMGRWVVSLALLLVTAFASSSFGQAVSSGTGAINGRVTDATQAVMPGVTITVTGPSLMGARTTVTDADGQYRMTAVPPGDYTLVFELSGFATVRNEGIRVSLGFTASSSRRCRPRAITSRCSPARRRCR